MSKTMNVNLVFNANTQQVKAQLNQLKTSINDLSGANFLTKGTGTKFTQDIKTATGSVSQLKAILQSATTEAGQLDLGRFTQSMQQAGLTIPKLKQELTAMGGQGKKIFNELTQSIANSTMSVSQTNLAVDKLWGSLKNVATWQISSKILYGFINSINNAYQYTKDLNESLNNIRIVTGYSVDEMANFADQANKAAKALSTSTLEYTKATQIYFQQGLTGREVTNRADVTLKLANVARTSGEEASEWMTAIWNNFYDGSKSLEYYADVLTKLGAATASSSDEIAGGLEKFSAVADTINLSYEYAAAALATITAETRQSEDVVGTALKTLFARMEGLKLGETLDDGTTLNQYSEAMMSVGINIKDANGELKDMDIILDEMGAKWNDLSKAQQVALAQSVGGIRQYNQLISLMDNWDVFERNVEMSRNATGELNKQNDIYAESWEAANKRVKASAEELYSALLDDEFFISLTDGVASVISGISSFVKTVGGIKTILPGVILLFTKLFGDKIIGSVATLNGRFKETSKAATQAALATKQVAINETLNTKMSTASVADKASAEVQREILGLKSQTLNASRALTEEEQRYAQMNVESVQNAGQVYESLARQEEQLEKNIKQLQDEQNEYNKLAGIITKARTADDNGQNSKILQSNEKINQALLTATGPSNFAKKLKDMNLTMDMSEQEMKDLYNDFQQMQTIGTTATSFIDFQKKLDKLGLSANLSDQELEDLYNTFQALKDVDLKNLNGEELDRLNTKLKRTKEATNEAKKGFEDTAAKAKQANSQLGAMTWDSILMKTASAASSVAMAFNAITSIFDTWSNQDLSLFEKISNSMMSLTMVVPAVVMGIKAIISMRKKATVVTSQENNEIIENTANLNANTVSGFTNAQGTKYRKNSKGEWQLKFKNQNQWRGKGHIGTSTEDINRQLQKPGNTDIVTKTGKAGVGLGGAIGTIAVAAAGIAILATSIKLASNYYNKLENSAKKANENAHKLRETAQQTQEAYNNMLSTSKDYQEGYKGLDLLIKGTNEYKQSLLETNAKARELLKTHKNLKYTIDANGAIKIDEMSLALAQDNQYKQALAADAAATSAEQNARHLDNQVAFQQELRANSYDSRGIGAEDTGAYLGGAGAAIGGALTAAAIVSAIPVAGWVAGALIGLTAITAGLITYAVNEEDATKSEEAAIRDLTRHFNTSEKASQATKEEMQKLLNDKGYDDDLIQALTENSDKLQELIETEARNNELQLQENQMMVKQQMQANGTYDDYDDKAAEYIANIGGANLEFEKEALKLQYQRWGKDGLHKGHSTGGRAKEYANEYLEAAQLTGWTLADTTGTDSNRKFVFEDAEGKKQTKTLEEMKAVIINHKALQNIDANTKETAALVAKLRTTDQGNALLDYISEGHFDNATGIELEALKNKPLIKELDVNNDNIVDVDELRVISGSLKADEKLEDLKTLGWGTKGITKGDSLTDKIEEVAGQWLEAKGNPIGWKVTGIQGNDENRVFVFDTPEGEQLIPLSQMRRDYALYMSAEDYQSQLNKDAQVTRDKRNAVDDDLANFELKYYTGLKNNAALTTAQLAEYTKLLQASTTALGTSGGENFQQLYDSVLVENKDKFTEAINTIDWGNTTIAEATAMVEGLVDTSSDTWLNYAQAMIKAANSALSSSESFNKLRKSIASINTIVKDLSIGKIISDEEYKNLIEKNKSLASSFAQVADGWRVIADPENIKTNVYNVLEEEFDTALSKAQLLKDYVNTTFDMDNTDQLYSDLELRFNEQDIITKGEEGEILRTDTTTAEAQLAALQRIGAIKKDYSIDSLMLAQAGISEERYQDMINQVLEAGENTDIVNKLWGDLYNAIRTTIDEENYGLYNKENVLTNYTDLKESFTEFNGEILDHNELVENTSKAYKNYAAKKTEALKLNSYEVKLLERQVRSLDTQNTALKENSELVSIITVQNAGLNKGLLDLVENAETYSEALQTDNFSELENMFTSIKNIFDLTDDEDPYNFIIQNWDLVQQLLKGNADVVDDLQKRLAQTRLDALHLTGDVAFQMQSILDQTDFNMDIFANLDISNARNNLIDLLGDAELVDQYINQMLGGSFWLDENGNVTKIMGSNLINRNALNTARNTDSSNEPEEFDPKRYHEIDEVLEDIGRNLDIIGEKKDKAFGTDKIAYMTKELTMLNDELTSTEEKLTQAEDYYIKDRDAILKYGVELDEAGRIANYTAVRQRYYDQYATNPEAYEESWSKLNEELDQYEETLDIVNDLKQEILEKQNAIKEAELEVIDYTVTSKIDASDDQMKYLERMLKHLDDSAYDAANAIGEISKQMAIAESNVETYKDGINGILDQIGLDEEEKNRFFLDGDGSVFTDKEVTEAQVEKLREYRDAINEIADQMQEYATTVHKQAVAALEAWNEKLDENANKIERCNKLLDEYKNIIDVVGKDYLNVDNELLQAISDTRAQLATDAVSAAAAKNKVNQEALKAAQEIMDEANASGDKDVIQRAEETLKTITEAAQESEEALISALSNAMQVAADEFESAVERAMDTLNEALGNIDKLTEQFEKQRELEELYLADHKKIYEINKLNRDIQKSIDETDNVKAQRELASIAEEVMAYQADGAEMSKYDLGYLQKRYDLKKAEIALEEAQNAKNQVKLQRDSKGNWGYVYTADQSNINQAQENYDKSLYELQEFEYQSQRELTESYLDLQQRMMDELAKLRASDFANEQEYEAKRQEIINHYTQMSRGVLGEIKDLTIQSAIVNKEYNTTMADSYEDTLIGKMYPTYDTFEELTSGISEAIDISMEALGNAYSDWETVVNRAFEESGLDAETFATYMETGFLPTVQDTSSKASTAASDMAGKMREALLGEENGALTAVQTFEQQFRIAMENIYAENGIADKVSSAMRDISSTASTMVEEVASKAQAAWGEVASLQAALKAGNDLYRPPTGNDTLTISVLRGATDDGKTIRTVTDVSGKETTFLKGSDGLWYNQSDAKLLDMDEETETYQVQTNNAYTTNQLDAWGSSMAIEKSQVPDSNPINSNIVTPVIAEKPPEDPIIKGQLEDLRYVPNSNGIYYIKIQGRWFKIGANSIQEGKVYSFKQSSATHFRESEVLDKTELTIDNRYNGEILPVHKATGKGTSEEVGTTTVTVNKIGIASMRYDGEEISIGNENTLKQWYNWYGDRGAGKLFAYYNPNSVENICRTALKKFDTGGYTGDWGSDGRLAMLHQKEIVLNAHDTENFLAAVKIVRSMSDMLEQNAAIASRGLQIENRLANTLAPKQQIEQNVKIEASFPNATDRYEIEQAFNSLINDATQYVNRN